MLIVQSASFPGFQKHPRAEERAADSRTHEGDERPGENFYGFYID